VKKSLDTHGVRPPFLRFGGLLPATSATLMVIAIIFGGGTYQRGWPNAVVQLASLPLLAIAVWQIPLRAPSIHVRLALLLMIAIVALPLFQLVPLPPNLWTALPGREPFAAGFREANIDLPWLPISLSPSETWRSALSLLPPVAVFLAALNLDWNARRAVTILLILAGFLSVVVGLAQVAGGPSSPLRLYGVNSAAVGFFINENHFAALLYTMIPFAAAWAIGLATDRRPEILVGILLCLLVIASLLLGLGIAQSRAGLVIAIFAGLASIALTRIRTGASPGVRAHRLILLAVFVGVLLILQFASVGILSQLEKDPLRAALDYFPFGSGFGTFDSVYHMYETASMLDPTYVNNAHNDFAEAFLEGGLIFVAILLAFLGWFLLVALRIWQAPSNARSSALDISLARAANINVILLLLHSGFDYPLRAAALSSIFAFSCALLLPPLRSASHHRSREQAPRKTHEPAPRSPGRRSELFKPSPQRNVRSNESR
jgi:hypothetical protein